MARLEISKLRRFDKNMLRWLGGGMLALFGAGLGFLYLRGLFRQEASYRVKNVPSLADPRFPLLVVSLSNALATKR